MLKKVLALVSLNSLLLLSLAPPLRAQTEQPPAQLKIVAQLSSEGPKSAADLKKVFGKESAKFKAETARFDPVKAEQENAQQKAQKRGWSKTKKTLVITAIAVGVAALLFVAIKYYRKCLRYSDDCTYNPDTGIEDCPCEEYEQKNP